MKFAVIVSVIILVVLASAILLYWNSDKGRCEFSGELGRYTWNEERGCCCDSSSYSVEAAYESPADIPESILCCWSDEMLTGWCGTYDSVLC